ncbi:MAG: ClpXP protease specificity-enhancing factor [Gammaproteobacteria bacterium]|jgi:stringent starvation protein B|nr:ClpXP protease specificity-enhancing factor [Gammaproteobacteria bacterium]
MSADLTSTRPYLLRAMHAWMTDNNQTPLMVVAVDTPEVRVPEEHVENGSIVLNISWSATRNLELDNDAVSFEARFGGQPHFVRVPVESVRGIYARESGQGMMFQDQPPVSPEPQPEDKQPSAARAKAPDGAPVKKRPELKIVKP